MEPKKRQPLDPVSDQMKAWSAALAAELRDWPHVTQKSFFGFTALYRDRKMFGVVPRTRGIFKRNSVAFRFEQADKSIRARIENDPRVAAFDKDKRRWYTFELAGDSDLHDALDYLGVAFAAAKARPKKKAR